MIGSLRNYGGNWIVGHIDIKFLLSTMKPLHAIWLISSYNKLSSVEGKEVILSGWKASGITEALLKGVAGFNPVIDPFHEVDPFNGNVVDFAVAAGVLALTGEYAEEKRCAIEEDDGFVLNNDDAEASPSNQQ